MLTQTPEKEKHPGTSSSSEPAPIQLPRCSGLLLHISSLPGPYGIGDIGPNAYRFADLLAETGQRIWQVLPLVPVGLGHSPYSSPSTFAVNPLFISPERLVENGLLDGSVVEQHPADDHVDFSSLVDRKHALLSRAFDRFEARSSDAERAAFREFCAENADWLDDYALFMALKTAFGGKPWTEWPAELAARKSEAIEDVTSEYARPIERHKFLQYVFTRQWSDLKAYCNERDVSLFGDLPIYVAHDSADVWAHRELFFLDEQGRSTVVAGVPPDYFSETGQRWGNPIYRWDRMRANDYIWWTRRFERILEFVDLIRLDHFRGFAGYWEIPASEETAVNGRWVEGPGPSLFRTVGDRLGSLPLVAENLGLITPDVTDLMNDFGFPGMAVLQFAFSEKADHPFLPHNLTANVVAYTGTHDNDTFLGWWNELRDNADQARAARFAAQYLDPGGADWEIHWAAIRAMMASPAKYVVSPMQDVLGLGSEARMNTPGRGHGNWTWRFRWDQVAPAVIERLKALTAIYGRSDMLDAVTAPTRHIHDGDVW